MVHCSYVSAGEEGHATDGRDFQTVFQIQREIQNVLKWTFPLLTDFVRKCTQLNKTEGHNI